MNEYTTIAPANIIPGSLQFPSGMISDYEDTSSRTSAWPSAYIEFPRPSLPSTEKTFGMSSAPRDSFIGMLEPGEADRMKEKVALFKKRFDDDLARRNKILFGE